MEKKQLTRSTDKMLAGVCSGIAEYFDLDPTLVRVCYAVLTIFTTCFPGLLLYLFFQFAEVSQTRTGRCGIHQRKKRGLTNPLFFVLYNIAATLGIRASQDKIFLS